MGRFVDPSLRRYWYGEELKKSQQLSLEGDVFHHIFRVNKHKRGEQIYLLSSVLDVALVEVIEVHKKSAELWVQETFSKTPPESSELHLVLALPKIKTFEFLIEKSVELGVHSIHLVETQFSQKKETYYFAKKKQRWEKMIQSALAQSNGLVKTQISPIKSFEEFYLSHKPSPDDQFYFLFEHSEHNLNADQYKAHLGKAYVFVGSEGGFSEPEVQNMLSLGHTPLSLGPQILRVETAAIVGLGWVQVMSIMGYTEQT